MSIIAATCPKCGANLEVPQGLNNFFCQYCGAKMIKDVDYVELTGSVKVEGIATADSLLERAYIFISDGKFIKAAEYIEKVLDINPRYAKAYFGKFLCQTGAKGTQELIEKVVNPQNYNSFKRAVMYAAGSEKLEYIALADSLKEPVERKKARLADDIIRYNTAIENLNKQQEKIIRQIKWSDNLSLGRNLFFAIPLVLFVLSIIGTFAMDGNDILLSLFFVNLPLGVITYFAYRRIIKVSNLPNDLQDAKLETAKTHDSLRSAEYELALLE